MFVSRALAQGAHSLHPINLGLEGSLEAQLALEAVIQVGPGGCAHPVQGRGVWA